jgi:hypothetical protein
MMLAEPRRAVPKTTWPFRLFDKTRSFKDNPGARVRATIPTESDGTEFRLT